MILVFDVGNSAIKAAFFEGDNCLQRFTLDGPLIQSVSSIEHGLKRMAGRYDVTSTGCVSVVPVMTKMLASAVGDVFGLELQQLTTGAAVPIEVLYQTPETLGADRLALAVAAHARFSVSKNGERRAVIALDAGTAVTTEVISDNGWYVGGSIAPGPDLMRQSLNNGTAQLPLVDLVAPENSAGASTDEAIRSGVMFGFLDSVQGMLLRHISVFDTPVFVVATGGWAKWLDARIPEIDHVEPDLVLYGVREMMEYADKQSNA